MLKVMRDSFQQLKWILVFIVAIFILFIFMDWGVGGANPGSDSDSFAARVNGETIPIDEFERALYFTEKRYESMYGQPITQEMRDAMGLSRQVLNSLIEEKLMLQQARRLNLDATEAEIRREILEMPALSPEGKFVGPDAYEGWVRRNTGYQSVAAFEQEVGRGVTLEKINSALRNSVIITPAAAEAEYRRRNESAKIRYVLLSAESLLPSITVTPGEVQAYYRAHSTDYSHPEQRNVKYLLADLTRIRAQVTVTEAELRARYDATREEFKAPESVRAQHILLRLDPTATPQQQAEVEGKARDLVAQLRGGGDFAALAKQHSQDPGSATNGGDLGVFERGRMVAEFEAAAFSAPIGTISDPVKTTYGYHIIKVNEKRPGGNRPFLEVRSQIEQQLREQKAAEMARERIAQAKVRVDQARPKTDADLRAFADSLISFNETGWFGRNEAILGMGRLPALNDWAFRSRVGEVGTQLETPRGPIIPYLSGTREAGVAALEEVTQRVENEVKREKAREVARKQLQSTFNTTKTVDATARQLSLTPVTSDITRTGFVTGLTGKVESMVNEALSGEAGAVKGPLVVDQGAVVFEITERKKFDPNEFAANKQSLIGQMQQTEAPKLRASLLGKLREEADVIVNTRVIQSASQPQPAA